jgi:Tol biopolymer transport system component
MADDARFGAGPAVRWITEGTVVDYWPVFSPDGAWVLFTRTVGARSTLYVVPAEGGEPRVFLSDPPSALTLQTRPDWSWHDGAVAFAGNGGIWLTDGDGASPARLEGTEFMIYPAWYPGGDAMAVMYTRDNQPDARKIDRAGATLGPLSPPDLYTGMPSVYQLDPTRLAYPGQPREGRYNQDVNRIWVSEDGGTTARRLDDEQGRQCWWAPTGPVLAFMSTRGGHGAVVYLATPDGGVVVPVTDPAIRAQHPKFSPDATRIVFAGTPHPGGPTKIGILDFGMDAASGILAPGA